MRHGRRGVAVAAGWVGFLLVTAMAMAQGTQAPGTPTVPGQTAAPQDHPMRVPQASTAQRQQQSTGEGDLAAGSLGPGLSTTVWQWKGLSVDKIQFEGVTFGADDLLPRELAQRAGEPLDPAKVRESIRRLFASGRYRDIEVRGVRQGDGLTLIFAGPPQYFVGRVTIEGVRDDRLASLLRFATRLTPGTAVTEAEISAGSDRDQANPAAAGLLRINGIGAVGRCGTPPEESFLFSESGAAGASWGGNAPGG